jgi:CRISPR/Cas system-associated exonuclease Cas4 (RecB family)
MSKKKKRFRIPERCLSEQAPAPDPNFDIKSEIERIHEEANKESWSRKMGVYHPSTLYPGMCRRAIWYDRTGQEPESRIPPDLRMLFDLGHTIHDMIQAKLEKEFSGFTSEVAVECEDLHIYGHTDGVFKDEEWVFELKTVGESVYRNLTKPDKKHVFQVHCYMYGLDIPRCQLLYINRATGAMRLFRVPFQTEIWEQVCEILKYVEDHVKGGTTPPREINKWTCTTCKFKHVCEPDFSSV